MKERLYQEMSTAMPHDLVTPSRVMAQILVNSSLLSMLEPSHGPQTNRLRRKSHTAPFLSALGARRCSRWRKRGRLRSPRRSPHALTAALWPIENTGRPNIGLISSLSCFAEHQRTTASSSRSYGRVSKGAGAHRPTSQIVYAGEVNSKAGESSRGREKKTKVEELNERMKPHSKVVIRAVDASTVILLGKRRTNTSWRRPNVSLDERLFF